MAGISPMRQGWTYPDAQWTFLDDNHNVAPLADGTTFSLYIYNSKNNRTALGQGTWTATNLAQGIATYHWNTLDTSIPGSYMCFAQFTTPDGRIGGTDEEQLVILPLFVQQ